MRARPLSLTARTLYSELRELAVSMGLASDMSRRPGTVVSKRVRGRTYLYFQYRDLTGKTRQVYLGPDAAQVNRIIDQLEQLNLDHEADRLRLQELRAAFLGAGGSAVETAPMRVLLAFAEAGVFRPSNGYGALVGTLAFHAYGNLLGVQWSSPTRTQDIDVAGWSRVSIAVRKPEQPMPDILEQLNMGFIPVPTLDPKSPSTSFRVRGQELRVDLLTPETGKPGGARFVPALNAVAQPVRFLDYLIEDLLPVPVVGRRALVLANVPMPERFALHKLLVSESRDAAFAAKASKDRLQAMQLLEVLFEEAPDGVPGALAALLSRGPGWRQRLERALEKCEPEAPEVVAAVEAARDGQ